MIEITFKLFETISNCHSHILPPETTVCQAKHVWISLCVSYYYHCSLTVPGIWFRSSACLFCICIYGVYMIYSLFPTTCMKKDCYSTLPQLSMCVIVCVHGALESCLIQCVLLHCSQWFQSRWFQSSEWMNEWISHHFNCRCLNLQLWSSIRWVTYLPYVNNLFLYTCSKITLRHFQLLNTFLFKTTTLNSF